MHTEKAGHIENAVHTENAVPTEMTSAGDATAELSSGLDALDAPSSARGRRGALTFFAPIIALAAIIGVWQLIVSVGWQPDYILPSPVQVWQALHQQHAQGVLLDSATNSLSRGIKGFLISILVATPIGLLLGTNRLLRSFFRPILTGLQQLPSVAWVPAAIIWFGLSSATIYAVVLLGAIPSIANGLISGIDQVPPIFARVGHVLGANRWMRVTRILIPAAWPGFLAGLEQGWAFAWRSLMAAELIAVSPALGSGLGQMLDVGRQLGDMALVLGSILTIMIVGILIERLVFNPLRTRTLSNRGLLVGARS